VYHEELSKQLAEFLGKALPREGGMITLPDLYCIFNRARGSALISPEDLYRACLLFDKIGLPFKVKKLKSGVILVQSGSAVMFDFPPLLGHSPPTTLCLLHAAQYDDVATQARILKYVKEKGSVTALDLVRLDKVSILIAKEHLESAELTGAVCRDETIEGLRYFENLIKSCAFLLS